MTAPLSLEERDAPMRCAACGWNLTPAPIDGWLWCEARLCPSYQLVVREPESCASCKMLTAEVARLTVALQAATTPDICNTLDVTEYCEFAETDFEGLIETIPPNHVREVWANKSLPHHFAAHIVEPDESSRIQLFATEAEAEQVVTDAIAALPTEDTKR